MSNMFLGGFLMKKVLLFSLIMCCIMFSARAMNEMDALLRSNSGSQKGFKSRVLLAGEQARSEKIKKFEKERKKRRAFLSESTDSIRSLERNREGSHTHSNTEYTENLTLPEDIEIIDAAGYEKMRKEIAAKVKFQDYLLSFSKLSSFESLDSVVDNISEGAQDNVRKSVISTLPKDIEIIDFEHFEQLKKKMHTTALAEGVYSELNSIYSELNSISIELLSIIKRSSALNLFHSDVAVCLTKRLLFYEDELSED